MDMSLCGIYSALFDTPVWGTGLLLLLLVPGAMHLGREYFEGLGYQVAYSAKYGAYILVVLVQLAAEIIQRGGVFVVPNLFNNLVTQFAIWAVAFSFCLWGSHKTLDSRSGQVMDVYNDLFTAPIAIFFVLVLIPVFCLGGTWFEIIFAGCLLFVYAILFWIDCKTGRMDQRRWMWEHISIITLRGR